MLNLFIVANVALASVSVGFNRYPAFTHHGPRHTIESVIDRGLIAELIVQCHGKNDVVVMSYSKAERLYCTPVNECFQSFSAARRNACNH